VRDIVDVVRQRLADGRTIADADVHALVREIDCLREVVWLYVDPATVKPSHEPVIARCVPQ
jgi:hypothetical protein